METFIGQLVGFAAIVLLVWRYAVPPVRRMMTARQEMVRQQLKDSKEAAKRLEQSERAYERAAESAKDESERLIEEAKADSERIAEQLQAQAEADGERVRAQGSRQIGVLRAQLIRQLRLELGHESVRQAGELVRTFVADEKQQSATVDRFLDELDDMAPEPTDVEYPVAAKMRSASRLALKNSVDKFDSLAKDLDKKGLTTLADELVSVAKILDSELVVTRYLTVPSEDSAPRVKLVERLFEGKVGDPTLELLRTAVSERWSANNDLVDAIEHISRQALLAVAENDEKIDEVEDQLFRFSRILDTEPRLAILLGDRRTPVEGRVDLLHKVLDGASGRVNPVTKSLLSHTIELLRGKPADESVQFLAEVAVARRGELVAQVTAAAELSDAQNERLVEILGRIYGHPVAAQVQTDAELLGGLLITVGDEVIDGTLKSRLAAAEAQLPD